MLTQLPYPNIAQSWLKHPTDGQDKEAVQRIALEECEAEGGPYQDGFDIYIYIYILYIIYLYTHILMLVEVILTRFNQKHLNFNQLDLDAANKQHDPYPHRHKDGHSQTYHGSVGICQATR